MTAPKPNSAQDPTALTAIAVGAAKDDLRREITASQQLLSARMDGRDKLNDAQFKASEDAATKSENRFDRQLGQIQEFINAKTEGLDGKINDLRDRLTTDEGRATGVGKAGNALYLILALIVASITAAVAFFRGHT